MPLTSTRSINSPYLEQFRSIYPAYLEQLFPKPFSVSTMPSQKSTHFRTIQKFKADYSPASFSQYVSDRTGMHVVVVDQKGPKVRGYFALATEIFDDSGSPHTLE